MDVMTRCGGGFAGRARCFIRWEILAGARGRAPPQEEAQERRTGPDPSEGQGGAAKELLGAADPRVGYFVRRKQISWYLRPPSGWVWAPGPHLTGHIVQV